MAGKQAVPTNAFDPKLFAKRVQKVRNSQKKDFYDWIDRECSSIEKRLEPFAKGKVKKEKAAGEIVKLVKAEERELKSLTKTARDKSQYPEALRGLLDEVPDDADPKLKIVVTRLAEAAAELTEKERQEREKQVSQTLQLIARNQGQLAKVYGSEVADPVTVLTLALAVLLDYVSRKKK